MQMKHRGNVHTRKQRGSDCGDMHAAGTHFTIKFSRERAGDTCAQARRPKPLSTPSQATFAQHPKERPTLTDPAERRANRATGCRGCRDSRCSKPRGAIPHMGAEEPLGVCDGSRSHGPRLLHHSEGGENVPQIVYSGSTGDREVQAWAMTAVCDPSGRVLEPHVPGNIRNCGRILEPHVPENIQTYGTTGLKHTEPGNIRNYGHPTSLASTRPGRHK